MILGMRTLVLLGVAAFTAFLILLMPARLALSLVGVPPFLEYQDARGSIWQAQLVGAQVQGRPAGVVELSLSPFALLAGGLNADVRFNGAGLNGSFSFTKGKEVRVDALDMALDVKAVFGATALSGVVTVRDGSFDYDKGRCTRGSGAVRTNVFESGFAAFGVQAPLLAGKIGCQGGKPTYRLAGENELVMISVTGEYVLAHQQAADIVVTFKNARLVTPDLKSALEFAGLRESNEGWRGRLNLDLL